MAKSLYYRLHLLWKLKLNLNVFGNFYSFFGSITDLSFPKDLIFNSRNIVLHLWYICLSPWVMTNHQNGTKKMLVYALCIAACLFLFNIWALSSFVSYRPSMTMTSTTLSCLILSIIAIKKLWIHSFPVLGWSCLLIVLRTWRQGNVGEIYASLIFSAIWIVYILNAWVNS